MCQQNFIFIYKYLKYFTFSYTIYCYNNFKIFLFEFVKSMENLNGKVYAV